MYALHGIRYDFLELFVTLSVESIAYDEGYQTIDKLLEAVESSILAFCTI